MTPQHTQAITPHTHHHTHARAHESLRRTTPFALLFLLVVCGGRLRLLSCLLEKLHQAGGCLQCGGLVLLLECLQGLGARRLCLGTQVPCEERHGQTSRGHHL